MKANRWSLALGLLKVQILMDAALLVLFAISSLDLLALMTHPGGMWSMAASGRGDMNLAPTLLLYVVASGSRIAAYVMVMRGSPHSRVAILVAAVGGFLTFPYGFVPGLVLLQLTKLDGWGVEAQEAGPLPGKVIGRNFLIWAGVHAITVPAALAAMLAFKSAGAPGFGRLLVWLVAIAVCIAAPWFVSKLLLRPKAGGFNPMPELPTDSSAQGS